MTYDEYNQFCSSLPATTYCIQWGGAHVWKVGGKVFAIAGWEKNDKPAVTFKASELDFEILQDIPGYRPAPYMASRGLKWIQHYDVSEQTLDDLKYYIQESHRLVSLGLSKKRQKELGLNQGSNDSKIGQGPASL
ncbi:MmcQ/YjbR family DNA-binding protein [Bermanella sp. R86510]|uniref:MmcQ/YjbR family DNA-binding protein n=1 Tax=unclassified Bermanella TaxID=2627862 RepID=UPI0037C9501F